MEKRWRILQGPKVGPNKPAAITVTVCSQARGAVRQFTIEVTIWRTALDPKGSYYYTGIVQTKPRTWTTVYGVYEQGRGALYLGETHRSRQEAIDGDRA